MTKSHAATATVSDMDLEDLAAHAAKARGLIAQVLALLPGLITMSVDERLHSNGKLKADEPAAMTKLLVAAGKHAALFGALADKDGGKNDAVFEPQPAIDDLARVTALQELTDDAASLAQTLSDTLLFFGGAAQDIAGPVHTIINANKNLQPALGSDAAEGLEFYAAHGRAAARTRQRNRAAKAATTPAK